MAMAVIQSQDCLRNRHHLNAFASRPPVPARSHRKRAQRQPLSSSPPFNPFPPLPPPPPKAGGQRGFAPPLSRSPPSPSPQLAKPVRASKQRRDWGKKSPSPSLRTDGTVSEGESRPRKPLVMEEVRILRRGEELKRGSDSLAPDLRLGVDDSVLFSPNRFGPEPEILPKRVGLAVPIPVAPYAGPAFFSSPSPSSLPLPSFLRKSLGGVA